jgi:hypothetical protein
MDQALKALGSRNIHILGEFFLLKED